MKKLAGVTKEKVFRKLKDVMDPELHLNIVDLGFIYGIEFLAKDKIKIKMTMTSPACPLSPYFESEIPSVLKKIKGIRTVKVEFVFDPPWTRDKISESAKEELRMRGVPI